MNEPNSDRSVQEKDLLLFLDSLGIKLPAIDPTLPDDYIVVKLDPRAAAILDAHDNKAVLLARRIGGRSFPLTIVFLRKNEGVLFCHSTLLLDSYGGETRMVQQLRESVGGFFSKDADNQLAFLEPSWRHAALTGQLDCRILWDARPDLRVVTDLLIEKLGGVCEIPLFPSVYNYNNPYDQNLLEVALPELGNPEEVLVLGTGAGLEALCIALKYRCKVDATDINPVAVANTIAACRRTGTDHLVHSWVSDGLKQVTKKYDAVLFEAPLATSDPQFTDPNRYDVGGRLLKEVLRALPAHLNPGGRLYLMSCPDLTPYVPPMLGWRALRYFEAKSQVAIHKIWPAS